MPLLPPETEKLWEFLSRQTSLGGHILVGGSAFALRIRHRISEDLGFAFHGLQRDALEIAEAKEALRRIRSK